MKNLNKFFLLFKECDNKLPFKNPEYKHKRYRKPKEIKKDTYKTVPISHTDSKKEWPKGTKARVGKSKKTDKWVIQSVLIPKKKRKD